MSGATAQGGNDENATPEEMKAALVEVITRPLSHIVMLDGDLVTGWPAHISARRRSEFPNTQHLLLSLPTSDVESCSVSLNNFSNLFSRAELQQVLKENQRLESKLEIMREQHALVAELLSAEMPVEPEQGPKGMP